MTKKEIDLLMRLMKRQPTPIFSKDYKTLKKVLNKDIPGLRITKLDMETMSFKTRDNVGSYATMEYKIKPEVWYEWLTNKK